MIHKINILPIIGDHLETLRDSNTKRVLKRDIIGFYAFPLCLAVAFEGWGLRIPSNIVGHGLTAYSIFIPLLINVLVLIYSILERNHLQDKSKWAPVLLQQLYGNIAYSVLVSVCSLALLTVYEVHFSERVSIFIRLSFAFLFFHLLLTSLMVMKRIHALISRDVKKAAEPMTRKTKG